MGIDYSGNMIVGAEFGECDFDIPEDELEDEHFCMWEWLDQYDLETMSPWYDADVSNCTVGFKVADVVVASEGFEEWLQDIKKKAEQFEKLSGTKARLIGMQNIW